MFDTGPTSSATRAKGPGAPRPAYLSISSLKTLRSDSPPQTITTPLDTIEAQRAGSENRLRRAWEDIIQRYSRDFDDADEIDITTCEIVVDKGWVRALDSRRQAFGGALLDPADDGADEVTASDGDGDVDGDTESDWVVDDSGRSASAHNPFKAGSKERSGIWDEDECGGKGIIGLRSPPAAAPLRRYEFEIIIPPSLAVAQPAPADTLDDPVDRVDRESTPPAQPPASQPWLEASTDYRLQSDRQKSATPCRRGIDDFVLFIPPSSAESVSSAAESAPAAEMPPRQEDFEIEILWDTLTTSSSADGARGYDAFKRGLPSRNTAQRPDAREIELPCKEEKPSDAMISLHATDARSTRDNEEAALTPCSAEINPVVINLDEEESVPIKPEYQMYAAYTTKSTSNPIVIVIPDDADANTESAFSKFKHKLSLQQLKIELEGPAAAQSCNSDANNPTTHRASSPASCETETTSGPDRKRPPPAPPHPPPPPPPADDSSSIISPPPAATTTSCSTPAASSQATRKRKRVPLGSLPQHWRRRERPSAQSDLACPFVG
ncbi:hypothetical protein HDU87_006238 [Geranomyces variabilis]|uniref:Uncharacterized protein n=1 Tax=Geranomyces variabilis TaxID=109894 RepID=A0AAD5TFX2_9FUNG|nr:hypothetical protein HDU87_006238 [Geranomyces variabilis]